MVVFKSDLEGLMLMSRSIYLRATILEYLRPLLRRRTRSRSANSWYLHTTATRDRTPDNIKQRRRHHHRPTVPLSSSARQSRASPPTFRSTKSSAGSTRRSKPSRM